MISCIFYTGSGLGNQLHRYIMARVVALDKGFDFGIVNPENFKGNDFMTIMYRNCVNYKYFFEEQRINNAQGVDVRDYDWRVKDVQDDTVIDGEFQGEKYFNHRLDYVRNWLHVEPLKMPDDLCVINFRGGEYTLYPDLFLNQFYWDMAIMKMKKIRSDMKFIVHTDDPKTAALFFPKFPIISEIGVNWRSIRYAKYLILSNSSFAILPALINENAKKIIAPKYWARHNNQYWALAYNKYKSFTHI